MSKEVNWRRYHYNYRMEKPRRRVRRDGTPWSDCKNRDYLNKWNDKERDLALYEQEVVNFWVDFMVLPKWEGITAMEAMKMAKINQSRGILLRQHRSCIELYGRKLAEIRADLENQLRDYVRRSY